MAIRTQQTAQHETMVSSTIVKALRSAFADTYREDEFQGLQVVTRHPQTQQDYPMIEVVYNPTSIMNAGIGHKEEFYDDDGVWREWLHRRFEGSVAFIIHTLSPLDRDVLADSLVDLISFGRLIPSSDRFYETIYGEDPENSLDDNIPVRAEPLVEAFLTQLTLATDNIMVGGKMEPPAPWGAEDALTYSAEYSLKVSGGYYNKPTDDSIRGRITKVTVTAINDETAYLDNSDWVYPSVYHDSDTVRIRYSEAQAKYKDRSKATFILASNAAQSFGHSDAARVAITLTPSALVFQSLPADAATVTMTVTPSMQERYQKTTAATVSFTLTPTSTDARHLIDSATVPMIVTVTSHLVDLATASLILTPSSRDSQTSHDVNKATFTLTPSAAQTYTKMDSAKVTFIVTPSSSEIYTPAHPPTVDAATVTMTVTPKAVAGFIGSNAATVSMLATPSSSETYTRANSDSATATFTLSPHRFADGAINDFAPVAWWKLNESSNASAVADAIGSNNGSYTNFGSGSKPTVSVPTLGVTGTSGTSISVNYVSSTSGGGITVPYSATLNPAVFSLFIAFKIPASNPLGAVSGNLSIYPFYTAQTSHGYSVEIFAVYNSSGVFNGSPQFNFNLNGSLINDAFPTSVDASIVHTISVTYDGSVPIMYWDGAKVGINTTATYTPSTTSALYIGNFHTPSGSNFAGIGGFDNPAVFNKALTAYQVKSMHDAVIYGYGKP